MSASLHYEPLPTPRLVRERRHNRPALQIAWITDGRGRRLFAEVVRHTSFVRPADLDLDDVVPELPALVAERG